MRVGTSMEAEELQSLIDKIADIAHCGGLAVLTESDSLIAIRKLTITHWKKNRSPAQMKIDVQRALIAPSTACDLP